MGKQLLALAMGALLSTSASADIKNKFDMFAFFDTDSVSKLWTGGGASDYRKYVSLDYANMIGGGTINLEEIEPIFQAVTGGNGTKEEHGLEGVTLNFVTTDSFSISYPGAADTTETVVFLGDYVENIISANATGNIDIKNKKSNFAMMNTNSKSNISIGGGKDDARKIVSEEFAELTGGSKIDRDKKARRKLNCYLVNQLLISKAVGMARKVLTVLKLSA
ncbi:hypothetical protein JCM19233_7509 [Vibrio astriarenae]|nr:hypothetical protein JCM19233_7509 [Vibrio sp. C7]